MLTRHALAALLVLALAAPAEAATTYVAGPGSTRQVKPCNAATPCQLAYTIAQAVNGDDVLVQSGEHHFTGSSSLKSGVVLHGETARPLLVADAAGTGIYAGAQAAGDPSPTIRHLEFRTTFANAPVDANYRAVLDDVIATSTAAGGTAVSVSNNQALLTNVVASASGANSRAIAAGQTSASEPPHLVHVTARASGAGSIGILAASDGFNTGPNMCFALPAHLTLVDVIARGEAADIEAKQSGPCGSSTITVSSSNFHVATEVGTGAITEGSGNQTSSALTENRVVFLDSYHQKIGAPTVDAGADSIYSALTDLDGDARAIGAHSDIGADERQTLGSATSGDATAVTAFTATLAGSASAGSRAASGVFDWGLTTAYGTTTTAVAIAAGGGPAALAADLAGLTPGTIYHYRARAFDSGPGALDYLGADKTFTTAPAPPAPSPSPSPTATPSPTSPAPAFSGLTVPKRYKQSRTAKPGVPVLLTLARAGSTVEVTVTAKLRSSPRAKVRTRRLRHLILRGQRAGALAVRIKASRATKRLLRRQRTRQVRAKLTITVTPATGAPLTQTVTILLTR
jgi:hypothetical protein